MTNNNNKTTRYRGRFAPSPTGPLHFGSLVAAMGSYLEARTHGGEWLVRIEDIDTPREVPGASSDILRTLEYLGLNWDGEVVYQSQRSELYLEAIDMLTTLNLTYRCICTRKEILDSSIMGIIGSIYPGTCRHAHITQKPSALRLCTNDVPVLFEDILQGHVEQRLESDTGDFVLCRADGIFAYHLAVVVDDAKQNITHVVRGEDLLDSTPRQIYLYQLLNYPVPNYMHLPVVTNRDGKKLSKQTCATPVDRANAVSQLIAASHFLGQTPPADLFKSDLPVFWQWAQEHWQSKQIPRCNRNFIDGSTMEK